VAIVKTEKAYI